MVTKAHIKVDEPSRKGAVVVDGKIMLKGAPLLNADGTTSTADPGWRST